MNKMAKERDAAFIEVVLSGKMTKLKKYAKKYAIPYPEEERIAKAVVYKAIQHCENIPKEIKYKAYLNCIKLGFKPYIKEDNQ